MENDEPRWGEAPSGEMIAELLVERFPIQKGERVTVRVDEEEKGVALQMTAGRHVYRIRIDYLRGAGNRDPWMLMVDALDNLFGMFIESNREYRELPFGSDVEFQDAFLRVAVEHEMPEVDRIAQQILERGGHPEDE